jgi:GNAT superfamily N-acetyltransferase
MNHLSSRQSRSVRISFAQPEDAERVTAVINSAFRRAEAYFVEGDRIDVGGVLHYLNSGKFLLAESEGTLLGCVYVEPLIGKRGTGEAESKDLDSNHAFECRPDTTRDQSKERAYLGLLAVDPAHQQSGLGSILMDAAEDYCRGLGHKFMDIKVVNLREGLFGFYRTRGYVETGTSTFPAEVETKVPCHFIDMSKSLNEDKAT